MPPARTKAVRLKRERASDRSRKPRGPLPPELEHHGSGRMLQAVKVLVPLALVLTVGPIAASRSAGSTGLGGPLEDGDFGSSRTLTGMSKVEPGEAVSIGLFVPWNTAPSTATLDSVRTIDKSPGLQIVGTGSLPSDVTAIGAVRGFPPSGYTLTRVGGSPVPPGSGPLDSFQLVIGIRAAEPGLYSIPAFDLRYHVEGREFHAILLQGAWLCVSGEKGSHACAGTGLISEQQTRLAETFAPFMVEPDRPSG
jgi:hypothetical protein